MITFNQFWYNSDSNPEKHGNLFGLLSKHFIGFMSINVIKITKK